MPPPERRPPGRRQVAGADRYLAGAHIDTQRIGSVVSMSRFLSPAAHAGHPRGDPGVAGRRRRLFLVPACRLHLKCETSNFFLEISCPACLVLFAARNRAAGNRLIIISRNILLVLSCVDRLTVGGGD